MVIKTEAEIRKAIKDSEAYFRKEFPGIDPQAPVMSLKDFQRGIKCLAVANEICTLKWVLGKGKMNCYSDDM